MPEPTRASAPPAPGDETVDAADRSTTRLIADLPALVVGLLRDELDALKQELTARIARLGIGAGLVAGAAFIGFFALAVFVAAAILALALVVPGWAAALIVFGGLLVIAIVLALVGARTLKKKSGEQGEH